MQKHFHLFAYGTLRSPDSPAARELLAGCERVEDGTVEGTLYDLGDYPALLLSGDHPVHGSLWKCPWPRLEDLDRYEGVEQGLFRRVGVRVGDVGCWTYVAGPALGRRLTADARVSPEPRARAEEV